MRRLRFTPAARRDLDDIWAYTEANWGPLQAEHYLRLLQATCADLAAGHRRGQGADHIRKGDFRASAGSHVVFFKTAPGFLDVVRILHRRMDVARHLPGGAENYFPKPPCIPPES